MILFNLSTRSSLDKTEKPSEQIPIYKGSLYKDINSAEYYTYNIL